MSDATRAALDDLVRSAAAHGHPAAALELRRTLDRADTRPPSANDVDSAIVRWADAVCSASVPLDVEDAAERVVESLERFASSAPAPS